MVVGSRLAWPSIIAAPLAVPAQVERRAHVAVNQVPVGLECERGRVVTHPALQPQRTHTGLDDSPKPPSESIKRGRRSWRSRKGSEPISQERSLRRYRNDKARRSGPHRSYVLRFRRDRPSSTSIRQPTSGTKPARESDRGGQTEPRVARPPSGSNSPARMAARIWGRSMPLMITPDRRPRSRPA